jgi:hypothetical protein
MNAKCTSTQRALRKGDVVELIRLMLQEREQLRLHPACTADALCAVNRGYAAIVSSNTTAMVLRRPGATEDG